MAVPTIKNTRWIKAASTTSVAVSFAHYTWANNDYAAVGDLMVFVVAKDDDDAMASSHGFTSISQVADTQAAAYVWYKILDADDITRGSVEFTGDSEDYIGYVYIITGFDSDSPISISAKTDNGSTASPQAPSITTVADTIVIAFFGADYRRVPYTLDTAGWTEDYNDYVNSAGICVARKEFASAGATGVVDFSMAASDQCASITFAINPEATASASGVKVKASGTWKDVTAVKMKISGTWTTMTAVKMKISGVWETIM